MGKEIGKDFFEGKTTLPLIIVFQRAGNKEREFYLKLTKKIKDLCKNLIALSLINKYKAVEESFKRAEYFVNVSRDALAIFDDSHERILQNLSSFSLKILLGIQKFLNPTIFNFFITQSFMYSSLPV